MAQIIRDHTTGLDRLVLAYLPLEASGQTQPSLSGDLRMHDPTMIEVDGTYIGLYTGREGGLERGAVRIKTSPDMLVWTDAGSIGRGLPDWIKEHLGFKPPNLWAPAISRFGDTHYLYYSASVFGINTSAIGLMTHSDLDPANPGVGWEDQGLVIGSTARDDFNAIDPFRVDLPDGRSWLTFGSFWSGIKLIELDPVSGMPIEEDPEFIALASRDGAGIEAPSILPHDGRFYLFVSFDQCCRGVDSTYHIRVGRADRIEGPYLDREGRPMLEGGGTLLLDAAGRFTGPGGQEAYATEEGDILVYHYYDAEDIGAAKLQIAPIRWTEDGWPYLDPLPE